MLLVIERNFSAAAAADGQVVIVDLPFDLALSTGTVQVRHLTLDLPPTGANLPPAGRYYLCLDAAKSSLLLLLHQPVQLAGAVVWFSVGADGTCSMEQNLVHTLPHLGPSALRRLCFTVKSCNPSTVKGTLPLVIHLEVL